MKKINQNVFFKICPDCGKYLTKNQHDFEAPEILNPDNCYGYRRCTLCSIQVFDNFHNYYEIKKMQNAECTKNVIYADMKD